MSFLQLLLGRPLATSEERAEEVGVLGGIPVFGLDALSSAAYGPEAALTLLLPMGLLGTAYVLPITIAIVILLAVVYVSYLQTITAYPHGGGSYTVASENLGRLPGLLAAAALIIDYVLNAAVGISAGVSALVSAVPSLHPHILLLCLVILGLLFLVNLRGVHDTGTVFLTPTYVFVGSLLFAIIVGLVRTFLTHGHPVPVYRPEPIGAATQAASVWLLLRAFASGCSAMTGVEAVSNGVQAFREPKDRYAKRTLTVIVFLLMLLLIGVSVLCRYYGIGAVDPNAANYQSVLSQLIAAVMGRGWFYYGSMASVLAVLALSANTSFADFPRLTRAIAIHDYLPHVFRIRGRRLLYSHGIFALTGFTAVILIIFGGVTDRLIPLFAIGAFLAFTLSQAGMVVHWLKVGGRGSSIRAAVNGFGAVATGVTTCIVLATKFLEGAWLTVFLVIGLMLLMLGIHRHYTAVECEMEVDHPLEALDSRQPVVILPIDRWTKVAEKSLRFALGLSTEIKVVHVDAEESTEQIRARWQENVGRLTQQQKGVAPELVILSSPYRYVLAPLLTYLSNLERDYPDRQIAILVPEVVVKKWWQEPLHNQRAKLIRLLLLLRGNHRVVIVSIPWFLQAGASHVSTSSQHLPKDTNDC